MRFDRKLDRVGRGASEGGKLACLLAMLLIGRFVSAQSLASVTGTVADPSGAVIPKASLILRSMETQAVRETVSNSTGRYAFQQVQPGHYTLDATANGFANV